MSMQNPNAASCSPPQVAVRAHRCTYKVSSSDHSASQIALPEESMVAMIKATCCYLRIIMRNYGESPRGKRRRLWTLVSFHCNHYNGQEEGCFSSNTQK